MSAPVSIILYPTSDIAASKAMFTRLLGAEPSQDAPYYVGFEVEGMTIGLDPTGEERGMTGATPFFEVADIGAALAELKAAGADVVEDARTVGPGRMVAMVSDSDGNMIGLVHNT
jgi:predicted enzyme related to lactoylglutathione lyase